MNETTDLMTDYLEIQTGLGRAQDMSNDQLVAGTKKYITELDLLARITGQSRKEAAEEQKKIANDKTLRLAMASMGEVAAQLGDLSKRLGPLTTLAENAGGLFGFKPSKPTPPPTSSSPQTE